uniref:RRM domain-containing protein n=1 Tax=Oryza punctata TaxID=4537 RepID=A0A0E0LA01_ORYPU
MAVPLPVPAAAMADVNCRCSRVVYVGNIAFHASEAELRDACELIGPVRSLRLAAVDPATNKRKGYAFEVREMVATLEATELLKQQFPGLATAKEQAQRLLEMFAADEEEVARKKLKRASDSPPGGADEQHAKLSKVVGVDGGVKASSRIVPCF